MPLAWFALPVIIASVLQHNVSWIEFGDGDTIPQVAAEFCAGADATRLSHEHACPRRIGRLKL